MRVWSVTEGKDKEFWAILTFIHNMDCSSKSVWLPNIYRTCFFEKGQIRFCHDMQNYMWTLSKRGEIGPWNWGSLHIFQWERHLGGETMCHMIWRPIATSTSIRSVGSVTQSSVTQMSSTYDTLADNIGYWLLKSYFIKVIFSLAWSCGSR